MNLRQRQILTRWLSTVIAVLLLGLYAGSVLAVPVKAHYIDGPACDSYGAQDLTHEIGDAAVFPIDEALLVTVNQSTDPAHFTCVGDDGISNEWRVRITNISTVDYKDLFFVVDAGVTVGNADGLIEDVAFPGFTDAFRIDGTVTLGVNNPLVSESGLVDEILQSGETWEFLVTNFGSFAALPPPFFDSPGGFAFSSAGGPPSNASIVANLVPEPASLGLLVVGAALMGLRTRSNRKTCDDARQEESYIAHAPAGAVAS